MHHQSPWLTVSNKQIELMSPYMAELGLTPSARTRIGVAVDAGAELPDKVELVFVTKYEDGSESERRHPLGGGKAEQTPRQPETRSIHVHHDV